MELKATILLSKELILIFALLFYSQGDLDNPKNRSISELVGSWHITPTDHVSYQYDLTMGVPKRTLDLISYLF